MVLAALVAVVSAQSALDVVIIPSTVRHDAYAPLASSSGALKAAIAVAGREREAVQVLVRSHENQNVTLGVALEGPSMLPGGALQLHRAGLVWANNATDPTRVWNITCPEAIRAAQGGCWVPDPLLPLSLSNGSAHVPLTGGFTTSLWVTLVGPADVATYAGEHTAVLRLTLLPVVPVDVGGNGAGVGFGVGVGGTEVTLISETIK